MSYTANPVWPFYPDWDKGVLERLEWKTDVLASESNSEQRVSRRLTPRRSFEATFWMNGRDRQYFDVLMNTVGQGPYLIPVWHAGTYLQANSQAGATAIYLDTTYREYVVGGLVYLRGPGFNQWEIATVASIGSDHLQLIAGLANTWVAGTKVYPACVAKMSANAVTTRMTDQFLTVPARFDLMQANPYGSDGSLLPIYQGLVVQNQPPDESSDLSYEYQRVLTALDNSLGIPLFTDAAGATNVQKYTWAFAGRQSSDTFRRFLYAIKGRASAIWLPTFSADFTIAADIVASSQHIDVVNVGYTRLGANVPGRQDIRIETWDGASFYRNITASAEILADVERLALSTVLPADIPASNVRRISYVSRSRLEQDLIEINHVTDTSGLTISTVTWRSPIKFGANSVTWLDPVMGAECDCSAPAVADCTPQYMLQAPLVLSSSSTTTSYNMGAGLPSFASPALACASMVGTQYSNAQHASAAVIDSTNQCSITVVNNSDGSFNHTQQIAVQTGNPVVDNTNILNAADIQPNPAIATVASGTTPVFDSGGMTLTVPSNNTSQGVVYSSTTKLGSNSTDTLTVSVRAQLVTIGAPAASGQNGNTAVTDTDVVTFVSYLASSVNIAFGFRYIAGILKIYALYGSTANIVGTGDAGMHTYAFVFTPSNGQLSWLIDGATVQQTPQAAVGGNLALSVVNAGGGATGTSIKFAAALAYYKHPSCP